MSDTFAPETLCLAMPSKWPLSGPPGPRPILASKPRSVPRFWGSKGRWPNGPRGEKADSFPPSKDTEGNQEMRARVCDVAPSAEPQHGLARGHPSELEVVQFVMDAALQHLAVTGKMIGWTSPSYDVAHEKLHEAANMVRDNEDIPNISDRKSATCSQHHSAIQTL